MEIETKRITNVAYLISLRGEFGELRPAGSRRDWPQ